MHIKEKFRCFFSAFTLSRVDAGVSVLKSAIVYAILQDSSVHSI